MQIRLMFHVVRYHDDNEIGKGHDKTESNTDRRFFSLGGDRRGDSDEDKGKHRHGVRKSLAHLSLEGGVVRFALALLKRVSAIGRG